jgi:NAD(P)-dependent dehydrogenase (short-subunit alcohol dehydrogenase family)
MPPAPSSSRQTQVALVTGGAQGIGRGIAEKFLNEGFAVAIADQDARRGRQTLAALQNLGPASFHAVDVGKEAQVKRGIQAALRRHGRLDVLINNAGITDVETDFNSDRWRRIIDVNLSGAFYGAKYAAPALRRARGAIINISSTRALMSEPKTPAYSASKGGLVALTHSLAVTLGPGVRVNCISPGWVHTGPEKLRPQDHRQHPAGRVGLPEDIAALAFFLASPDAAFITGQNIVADGGMARKMIYA